MVFSWIKDKAEWLFDKVIGFFALVGEGIVWIGDKVVGFFVFFGDAIASIPGAVGKAIGKIIGLFRRLVTRIWNEIRVLPRRLGEFLTGLWDKVKDFGGTIAEKLKSIPGMVVDKLKGVVGAIGDGIKSAFESLLEWFSDFARYGVSSIRDKEGMSEIKRNRELIQKSDDPVMQLIRGETNVKASQAQLDEAAKIRAAAAAAGDDDVVKFLADAMANKKRDFNIVQKEVSEGNKNKIRNSIPIRILDMNKHVPRQ